MCGLLKFILLIYAITFCSIAFAAKHRTALGVGFYSCQLLYDTQDDFGINDEDFTPTGKMAYTPKIYQSRLRNIAKVIAAMNAETSDGLALLGLTDIENEHVLQDLCQQKALANKQFKYAFIKGCDRRGMNPALLYDAQLFNPISIQLLPVPQLDAFEINLIREILYVKGVLQKDTVHVFVNYWNTTHINDPNATAKLAASAQFCRNQCNSILAQNPQANILVMGNFNTNPTDSCIVQLLQATSTKPATGTPSLYNPFTELLQSGKGTWEFLDKWYIYDQIMLSSSFLKPFSHLFLTRAAIFKKDFMADDNNRFLGYPLSAFAGSQYINGFSDHFPVLIHLSGIDK